MEETRMQIYVIEVVGPSGFPIWRRPISRRRSCLPCPHGNSPNGWNGALVAYIDFRAGQAVESSSKAETQDINGGGLF